MQICSSMGNFFSHLPLSDLLENTFEKLYANLQLFLKSHGPILLSKSHHFLDEY